MTEELIRKCILCGSDSNDSQFTYTVDFLTGVLGMTREAVYRKGWREGTEATIVRCTDCGCFYVRNPTFDMVATTPTSIADRDVAVTEYADKVRKHDSYKHYHANDDEMQIVRDLVWLASRQARRDIRFLDFGSGRANVASMTRVLGVKDVVAYDPFYGDIEMEALSQTCFPGITFSNRRADLGALGRFDAAVFMSAIEHVADPRGELRSIYELLRPGGYLYVNNPFMDLAKDLADLHAAERIAKSDRLSHYHPWHLNYMTPRQFKALLQDVGFTVTNLAIYSRPPVTKATLVPWMATSAKSVIRTLQNAIGVPYRRYAFVVRRPA